MSARSPRRAAAPAGGAGWSGYLAALALVAAALAAGGWLYATQKHLPMNLFWAALPAFSAEAAFYLAPGFAAPRRAFARLQPPALRAALLASSALAPYLLLTLRLRAFQLPEFALLAALAAMLSFWYFAARPSALADVLFLAFAAAVFLSPAFVQIYPRPAHAQLATLGRLMWIHTGILAVLSIRGWDVRFGFLPSPRDWRVGVEHYLLFLPPAGALAWMLHAVRFAVAGPQWWKAPAVAVSTFFAFLWVVALAEEFFFRGFLQQLLARSWHSDLAALVAASLVFGAAHLPFRGFPNWRWSALAALLGLACGAAYWRTGGIRASMVTHALAVATWRTFFNG